MKYNAPTSHALQTAMAHHQAGRLAEAEQLYREILVAEPRNAEALHLFGLVRHQAGDHEHAVELIESAHRLGRPKAFSLNSLGMAYLALGRTEEGRRCFSRAVKLQPTYAEAHNNLGVAEQALGEFNSAAQCFRRALALKPDYADAHYNLGILFDDVGRHDEAERCLRQTLELDPNYADAHNNLGLLLADMGRSEEAERSYRRAIELAPGSAQAHNNLGSLLSNLGRLDEAEERFRKALDLDPAYARAASNLGATLHDLGRQAEAEEYYKRALILDPDHAEARWALTISRLGSLSAAPGSDKHADEIALQELGNLGDWFEARTSADCIKAVGSMQPFLLAYRERNNRQVLSKYGTLCTRLMHRWAEAERLPAFTHSRSERMRVGIVSAQIRDHSVWHAIIKGWLQHLDRAHFEISVLSLTASEDKETELARSLAAEFVRGVQSLRQNVDTIRRWQPDVLIYPEIGMDAMTLKLASLRLAPVQIAAWGHPETTGLPTIDYYLSGEDFEPANSQDNYTEKLVALPHLGCCYSPWSVPPVETQLDALGIAPHPTTLLCPGAPFKYAPEHDWVFIEIARALGSCQLVFFNLFPQYLSHLLRGRLRDAFSRAGMEFERYVVFIPRQSPAAFQGSMQRADAMLDTIGFSGFNTAMHAVASGLPIVTREGRFMRGRLASGILRRMHLHELIVASGTDYVNVAVKLARDASYRNEIRERISAARHVLYEDLAPVRALEDFLLGAGHTSSQSFRT